MRCVLLISPEPWSAQFVSKHHYALALAASGVRVFFVNPPVFNVNNIQLEALSDNSGITIVTAPRVARGLRYYPRFFRRALESRWLARLEKKAGCDFDTVWQFENSRFYDLNFAGQRLKIYHQVDLNQNFHCETAAATSDIAFCTTDFIREKLLPHKSRCYKVHHGFSMCQIPFELKPEQRSAFGGGMPNAMYVGNLDISYLDVELVRQVVVEHPHVRFHLVGKRSCDSVLSLALADVNNVLWWGQCDHRMVQSLLQCADVLMVVYRADEHMEQLASPHKMMEYFGSGNVVVSTYTDEYKDKRDLLEMVDSSQNFSGLFGKVVADLDFYNSADKRALRQEFAVSNSYSEQLKKILVHIESSNISNVSSGIE